MKPSLSTFLDPVNNSSTYPQLIQISMWAIGPRYDTCGENTNSLTFAVLPSKPAAISLQRPSDPLLAPKWPTSVLRVASSAAFQGRRCLGVFAGGDCGEVS